MPSPAKTDTQYFDDYTFELLAQQSQEDLTAGTVTMSAETHQHAHAKTTFGDFIRQCPERFFEALPALSDFESDLLLTYHLCSKPQFIAAKQLRHSSFSFTQTMFSMALRVAELRIARILSDQTPYSQHHFKTDTIFLAKENALHTDPPELGMFRVDVASEGFKSLFTPRGEDRVSIESAVSVALPWRETAPWDWYAKSHPAAAEQSASKRPDPPLKKRDPNAPHWNLGKVRSEETKLKMSLAAKKYNADLRRIGKSARGPRKKRIPKGIDN